MKKLLTRSRAGLLAAICGLLPVQAHAALPIATPDRIFESKSAAILGTPSKLALIRAQQRGEAVTARLADSVTPASLNIPVIRRAVLRREAPPAQTDWTGRPDVFGSVALKIGQTKLDSKWQRVASAPVSGAALALSQSMRGDTPIERIEAINRYVNRKVAFTDDSRQYGRADLWTAASDTLRRGKGDCEDYAIAKMQMLRAAGIPSRDLYLVLVKDLVRMADHAVLVVRAEGRTLLLDNGTDMVIDADSVQDYRPIFTFASTGTWTHGYRRSFPPPVVMASAQEAPKPIDGTDLALLQRSRSASLRAFMTGFSR